MANKNGGKKEEKIYLISRSVNQLEIRAFLGPCGPASKRRCQFSDDFSPSIICEMIQSLFSKPVQLCCAVYCYGQV